MALGTGLPLSGPLAPHLALLLPDPPSTSPWCAPALWPWLEVKEGHTAQLEAGAGAPFTFFPPSLRQFPQTALAALWGNQISQNHPEKVLVSSSTARIQGSTM